MFHWFLLSSLILSKDHQQGTGKRIPCLFNQGSLLLLLQGIVFVAYATS